jgi:uracil-DNA glycosylase family 4
VSFTPLIQIQRSEDVLPGKPLRGKGCDFCPLDKVHGVHKIMGKVRGRKIFVWLQSPGMKENKKRREAIGPAGKFLWYELRRVGITRDMVDIQNVVRCVPVDVMKNVYPPLKMRTPTKEEIKCCSLYTEQAKQKSKARLHLVCGQIAGKAVLGKEFNNNKRVFFSEALKAWVVYLDHPAYFIRQGYSAGDKRPANDSLKRFRSDLDAARNILKRKHNVRDQFYFIKTLDSRGVTTRKQARIAYRRLKREALSGHTLVFDTEEGKLDKHGKSDDNGKWALLCIGCQTKDTSYTFAVDHPDSGSSQAARELNKKLLRKLLTNPKIRKSAHMAAHDTDSATRFLGVPVKAQYDSLLGEYFLDPNAKAYGLEAISDRKYPDYMGYKAIKYPEGLTLKYREFIKTKKSDAWTKVDQAEKTGKVNLARLPWKKMVLYNGADCHLEKVVERGNRHAGNPPLMGVYIDASVVLYRMQHDRECFPCFDYRWYKKIRPLFKVRKRRASKQLLELAGSKKVKYKSRKTGKWVEKKWNPGSPDQMWWLIYEKLGIEPLESGANTRAGTMEILEQKHKKLKPVKKFREVDKALSMLDSYKNCADLNDRRLRTIWKVTGTSTGRMSSGKSKERTDDNVINFQNIHGDPFIKQVSVSDERWWKLYEYWLEHGDFTDKTWKQFADYDVYLGYDFSQNELRELAEESGDKELIRIFSSKKKWFCNPKNHGCGKWHKPDPHVDVGHAITGWRKEIIAHNDRFRKLIKNIHFGIVFGLMGPGLFDFVTAKGVKTTLKEINKQLEAYFKKFPGVKKLQDRYRKFVEKHKYIANIFGFKRQLMTEAQEEAGKSYWNRSVNSPIQGAAHQILTMSVATIERKPEKYKLLKNLVKEVHDALYARVKLKYLLKAIPLGYELMVKEPVRIIEHDFKLKKKVPLEAKPKAGFRYGVQIEGIGEDIKTIPEFLNAWCRENQKLMKAYRYCKKHKISHDEYMALQYARK